MIAQHLSRQEEYSGQVDGEYVRTIYLTSPLHDIGKVGIPDSVLLKPGRLTDREWDIMKQHTVIGAETLLAVAREHPEVAFLDVAHQIALTHHECFDGSGYPRGLSGEQIPLCGRIVALADVYDALTTRRVYKDAFSHDVARSIILKGSGVHFDPGIVVGFLASEEEFIRIRDQFTDAESPRPREEICAATASCSLASRREVAMRIILASPRGFCAGVNMAIGGLERALEIFGAPLYVYHEIVHNKRVVDGFRRRGVIFVKDLNAVPEGSHLVYSAHGVSPEVRRQAEHRRLRTIDATCPLVHKVHLEAARFARQGYGIVLIGHAGHDEVVGTLGTEPEHVRLVETVEDVDRLELPDPEKVAYLTQTTLSVDDAAQDRRAPPATISRRSWGQPRKTSATRPRTVRKRSRSWSSRPTSCSCWEAGTARTAIAWRRSRATTASRHI